MATADVKVYSGTPITWQASGGSYTFTLASLTTTSTGAWQGAKGDLTTPRGARMAVRLQTAWSTNPTGGATLEVYWAGSPDSTATSGNPANASGSDGNYTGIATAAGAKTNLQFIGILAAEAATASHVADVGTFVPDHRYGMPIVYNPTATQLSTTMTAHVLTVYPLIDQIQASA